MLRIRHQIKPRGTLDIGSNHIGESQLELANSTADFERRSFDAGRGDAVVDVVIDSAKKWLLCPPQPVGISELFTQNALI